MYPGNIYSFVYTSTYCYPVSFKVLVRSLFCDVHLFVEWMCFINILKAEGRINNIWFLPQRKQYYFITWIKLLVLFK